MEGKGVLVVAVAVGGVMGLVLFLVILLGGGKAASKASTAGLTGGLLPGAGLNTSAVPAAYAVWIEQAGSLCATFPAPVIAAQIDIESGFNPDAVSGAGAEGIAQFLPGTFAAYDTPPAVPGPDTPFNPPDAIIAQGRYDCSLATAVAGLAKATGISVLTLALDAYNAGLGAVLGAHGIPDNPQTEAYAPAIEAAAARYAAASSLPSQSGGSAFAEAVIQAAATQLGVPYVWGGGAPTGPTVGEPGDPGGNPVTGQVGFDCSGLVLYAVYQASDGAVTLPHSSEVQATLGQQVATGSGSSVLSSGVLQPGDIIAFQLDPNDYSHIGIYVGDGEMIDAPDTGQVVQIQSLNTPYWLGVNWMVRSY